MKFSINIGLGTLFAVGVYLQLVEFWTAIILYVVIESFFVLLGKLILSMVGKKIEKDIIENKDFLSKKYSKEGNK